MDPKTLGDHALALTSSDPEAAWEFITAASAQATTARQFGRLGSGPVAYFWSEHQDAYLPRLAAVASELPALVNLVVAEDRRGARAAEVMMLIDALAEKTWRRSPAEFVYTPPEPLAALVRPGTHQITEHLLLPNVHQFRRNVVAATPILDEELASIVDGYIRAPSAPDNDDDDDWWWALNRLVMDTPHDGWRAILAIIARSDEGVDLGMLGAGALETLVSQHGEALTRELFAEVRSNAPFIQALSSCYLFSLSEELLIELRNVCYEQMIPAGG